MPTGLEISREYIQEVILPGLRVEIGDEIDRLAVAVIGTGSDVQGWDDEISRDHHWGPRATIFFRREDEDTLGPQIKSFLHHNLPGTYRDYEVVVGLEDLIGVCCTSIESFFEFFLGTSTLPETDLDWIKLCETDLQHVTGGDVVIDGHGELTHRREVLHYYPETVWKKRIADWCCYATGRDAPYNLYRVAKRNDPITRAHYLSQCLRRQMELCFMLNRKYAPYPKWLNRQFRQLPRYAESMAPIIDEAFAEPDGRKQVLKLIEVNYLIADAIAEYGLSKPPQRREFDEGLTDLILYTSAREIYSSLPDELITPSFNQIELWEKMARIALLDPDDYVQRDYEK
jgi:hypothetical protein